MNKRSVFIVAALATSAAFAEPPRPTSWPEFLASSLPIDKQLVAEITKDPGNMRKEINLCVEAGRGVRAKQQTRRQYAVFEYLVHKRILNDKDLANIADRSAAVGMSTCGIFAAMGEPSRVHGRESRYGQTMQFVYAKQGYYGAYVHFDVTPNGLLVTSVSR